MNVKVNIMIDLGFDVDQVSCVVVMWLKVYCKVKKMLLDELLCWVSISKGMLVEMEKEVVNFSIVIFCKFVVVLGVLVVDIVNVLSEFVLYIIFVEQIFIFW